MTLADPHVPVEQFPDGVETVGGDAQELTEAARVADAVVVLVPHSDFQLGDVVAAAPWVLDCTSSAPDAAHVERL